MAVCVPMFAFAGSPSKFHSDVLKFSSQVTDIIVCGHYGCGGVRAAMENVDHGLLEHWLLNVRNVVRLHNEELQVCAK